MENIVTKTKYTEKVLKDFFKFHFRKWTLTLFIIGCVVVLLGAFSIFFTTLVSGVVLCVMGVFLLLYPKILETTSLNANKRNIGSTENYTFDKESVKIVTTMQDIEVANQEIKYTAFEKVDCNNNYIYLYVNKTSALVIERKSISEKEQEHLVASVSKAIESRKANKK